MYDHVDGYLVSRYIFFLSHPFSHDCSLRFTGSVVTWLGIPKGCLPQI